MSIDATYNRSFVIGQLNFAISATLSSDLSTTFSESVPIAKSGTLTTRTDDNTGTLTMASGHGITTGQRLDIYWSTGRRYTVLVGTVSGNSVPFDLGGGDNLPAVDTTITAMVPIEEPCVVTGNNVTSIFAGCAVTSTIVFVDGSYNILHAITLTTTTTPSYVWTSNDGGTNPLAGDSPTKILISHGDLTAAQTIAGGVQYNS